MLDTIISPYIKKSDIVFLVSNFNDVLSNSSDIDIYCVSKNSSSVHIFKDKQLGWVELFIDSYDDLMAKIENVDEIAINFLHEFTFVYGDENAYQKALDKSLSSRQHYKIPDYRKNIIKYRIKVLLSKYLHPHDDSHELQKGFLLNSMTYPLIQLVMEYHNVFPSSPKKWIHQLENQLSGDEFEPIARFLARACSREEIIALCDKYAGDFTASNFDKNHTTNNMTFIS